MTDDNIGGVATCADLERALRILGELGFGVEMILPADDPQLAVIAGHGLRLRLERGEVDRAVELVVPPNVPKLTIARDAPEAWKRGRAGMEYRDLIEDRHGGRFIASHIRIAEGGPVPDYVHHHAIRFQLIYCYRGWVRLVYEDQGPPFVMRAGECVLQPPGIRHRVLESSGPLEVVEITCPAVHATFGDRALELPTGRVQPDRDFGGQTFHWHRVTGEPFQPGSLGLAAATRGLVEARVVTAIDPAPMAHAGELRFGFVLRGELALTCDGIAETLRATDAFSIPPHTTFSLAGSPDLALLEVTVPAAG